jgi:hypothetical protein
MTLLTLSDNVNNYVLNVSSSFVYRNGSRTSARTFVSGVLLREVDSSQIHRLFIYIYGSSES